MRTLAYVPPRITHYPDGDVLHDAGPLCGAEVHDSITRSFAMCPTFSDCDRCLTIRGQR